MATADRGNHSLRWVDRLSRSTSVLVGWCKTDGNADGLDALFYFPHSILQDPNSPSHLLVTDYSNNAVQYINFITRETQTLIKAGLRNPTGITNNTIQKKPLH